jgi:thioredoxin-related protein
MKLLFSLVATVILSAATPVWLTDMDKAESMAQESHKLIVLSFSGSDWCIPCIRLHQQIFESESFKKYAEDNLILVNADFPRLKKNRLSKEQTRQNEALAEKYNPHGSFPLTLLLDANGKVLKQWDGMPNETPEQFTSEISAFIHGSN